MKVETKGRMLKLSLVSIAVLLFNMAYMGPSAILTPFAVSLGASTALAGLAFVIKYLVLAVTMTIFRVVAKYKRRLPLLIGCLLQH
jgi:predicted MFS family arabinose efflux permease